MKARIVNNEIVDICEDPDSCFHPLIASEFISVPFGVKKCDRYNGKTKEWETPSISETIDIIKETKLSRLAYMRRFSIEEEANIRVAAESDSIIKVILARLEASTFVDLSDPSTAEGLDYMVSKGLLDSIKASLILNTPVSSNEMP